MKRRIIAGIMAAVMMAASVPVQAAPDTVLREHTTETGPGTLSRISNGEAGGTGKETENGRNRTAQPEGITRTGEEAGRKSGIGADMASGESGAEADTGAWVDAGHSVELASGPGGDAVYEAGPEISEEDTGADTSGEILETGTKISGEDTGADTSGEAPGAGTDTSGDISETGMDVSGDIPEAGTDVSGGIPETDTDMAAGQEPDTGMDVPDVQETAGFIEIENVTVVEDTAENTSDTVTEDTAENTSDFTTEDAGDGMEGTAAEAVPLPEIEAESAAEIEPENAAESEGATEPESETGLGAGTEVILSSGRREMEPGERAVFSVTARGSETEDTVVMLYLWDAEGELPEAEDSGLVENVFTNANETLIFENTGLVPAEIKTDISEDGEEIAARYAEFLVPCNETVEAEFALTSVSGGEIAAVEAVVKGTETRQADCVYFSWKKPELNPEFDLSVSSVKFEENDEGLAVSYDGTTHTGVVLREFVFSGASDENTIIADTDTDLSFVFDGVRLSGKKSPVRLDGGGKVALELRGTNVITVRGEGNPGIRVGSRKHLEIRGAKPAARLYIETADASLAQHPLAGLPRRIIAADTEPADGKAAGDAGSDSTHTEDSEESSDEEPELQKGAESPEAIKEETSPKDGEMIPRDRETIQEDEGTIQEDEGTIQEDEGTIPEGAKTEQTESTESVMQEMIPQEPCRTWGAAIGSTRGEDCGSITVCSGVITAKSCDGSVGIGAGRGGSQDRMILAGGNINARVDNAENRNGTSVYPVVLEGISPDTVFALQISVNGEAYVYGDGPVASDENGNICMYLPAGTVAVQINGWNYTGENSQNGMVLLPEEANLSEMTGNPEETEMQTAQPDMILPDTETETEMQETAQEETAVLDAEPGISLFTAEGTNPHKDVPFTREYGVGNLDLRGKLIRLGPGFDGGWLNDYEYGAAVRNAYAQNRQKRANYYFDCADGFSYDGVSYDVRVYTWSVGTTRGYVVRENASIGAPGRISTESNDWPDVRVQFEIHLYPSGTLQRTASPDNEVQTPFNFVYCQTDIDNNEGIQFLQTPYRVFTDVNSYVVPGGTNIWLGTTGDEPEGYYADQKRVWAEVSHSAAAPFQAVMWLSDRKAGGFYTENAKIYYHLSSTSEVPSGYVNPIENGVVLHTSYTAKPGVQFPGYTFMGWYLDDALTNLYAGSVIKGDLHLYGRYIPLTGSLSVEKTIQGLAGSGVDLGTVPASAKTFTFRLSGTSASGKTVNLTRTVTGEGTAVFENVPVGTYTLAEECNSAVWTSSAASQQVTIGADALVSARISNQARMGHLNVRKEISLPDGCVISKEQITKGNTFTFHVRGRSDAGIPVDLTGTVTGEGTVQFSDLPVGTYIVEEIFHEGLWNTPEKTKQVTVTADAAAQVVFGNSLRTGSVKVTKTVHNPSDYGIRSPEGFLYRITGMTDTGAAFSAEQMTDASGTALFTGIPAGSDYNITEVKSPDGDQGVAPWWECSVIPDTVNVAADRETQSGSENVFKTGNLQIHKSIEKAPAEKYNIEEEKKNNYNESLAGFCFKLTGYSLSGDDVELYAVTDSTGTADFIGVPVGDEYTVIEIPAAEVAEAAYAGNPSAIRVKEQAVQSLRQYVDPVPQTVQITYDETKRQPVTTVIKDYHNALKKWRISITKADRDILVRGQAQQEASLENAVYGLFDGGKLIDTYTTDQNGAFVTDYYVLGDEWYLKELKASEGYLVDPAKYPVNASVDDIQTGLAFHEAELAQETQKADHENTVYEQVMKAAARYFKISGDTNETDKEFLKGAGFSVYAVSDIEERYGVDFGRMTDREVIQWLFDNVRNNSTQGYEEAVGIRTAVVYADADDADVLSGKLVKSYTYADGTVISAAGGKNAYILAEVRSGEDGVVKTARLPYGRYVMIETKVPDGYVAAAPVVFTVDRDDRDDRVLGDNAGTSYNDKVIWDADITSFIEIIKKDAKTGKIIRKPGAGYVIHDLDGAYFDWYMKDRTTEERKEYKRLFGDLVVEYSEGFQGSYESPYRIEGKKDEHGYLEGYYVRTASALPEGRYLVEEVTAPDGYVRQGFEGLYRTKGNGDRFYEIEDSRALKWLQYHKTVTEDMEGKYVRNDEAATKNNWIEVTVDKDSVLYDSRIKGFVTRIVQANEEAVGKLSVYTEGQYVTGSYQTDTGYGFEYGYRPVEGVTYDIFADESVYSQDMSGERIYKKGDFVASVTTDKNGEAFTEEVVSSAGRRFYGLPIGSYVVKERKNARGFVTSEENAEGVRFDISYEGEEVPIVFRDEVFVSRRQEFNIEIGKYSMDSGEALAGAEFALYAAEDITDMHGKTLVEKDSRIAVAGTTQKDGEVLRAKFNIPYRSDEKEYQEGGLPEGRYYVREIKAPEGYLADTKRVTVKAEYNDMNRDMEFLGDKYGSEYSFLDEKSKTVINLMDYDTEVELSGAELVISDRTGKTVAELWSEHGKNIPVEGLCGGETYTITVKTPRKYYTDTVYEKNYHSPYLETGYAYNGEWVSASVIPVDAVNENTAEFTAGEESGIQIVNIFAKSVKASLHLQKTGQAARTVVADGKLTEITYEEKGLPGAVYHITAKKDQPHPDGYSGYVLRAGVVTDTFTTDEHGTGISEGLPIGDYELTETKAPEGYVRDSETSVSALDFEERYVRDYFESGNYSVPLIQTDAEFENRRQMIDTGKSGQTQAGVFKTGVDGTEEYPMAGAEFTLYARRDITDVFGTILIPAGTQIETAVSNETGKAVFLTDLPIGDYLIRETRPPKGYYSSEAEAEVLAEQFKSDDSKHVTELKAMFKNPVTVTKIFLRDNLTGNELAGATLQILDDRHNVLQTFHTDNTKGEGFAIKGLEPGEKYIIREVLPRRGYTSNLLIPEAMSGLLKKEARNEVSFTLKDCAVDDKLTNVPGACIINLENAFVTGGFAVDKDGEGLYLVKQKSEERTFLNKVIDWVKTRFVYAPVKAGGAEFTVFAAEDIYHPDGITGKVYEKGEIVNIRVRADGGVSAVVLTDEEGEAVFDGLYLGSYDVKETNIPAGYVKNEAVRRINLIQTDSTTESVRLVDDVAFKNIRQKVKVSVTKMDAEHSEQKLEGAVFGLYTQSDIRLQDGTPVLRADTLIETAISDGAGAAGFEADLPLGKYYVKEIAAPYGYRLSDKKVPIDASHDPSEDEVIEIEFGFGNEQTKTVVNVMDYDTEEELDDVELTILAQDGSVMAEAVSVHNGNAVIRGLSPDHFYTLLVKKPRSGYADTIFEKEGFVSAYVADGFISDGKKYAVREVEVQSVRQNTAGFMAGNTADMQVVNIFLKPVKADLGIHKTGDVPQTRVIDGELRGVDYIQKGLPGAVYEVAAEEDIRHPDGYSGNIYSKGEVVAVLTTDKDGRTGIRNLYLGKYSIVETQAPKGYYRSPKNCAGTADLLEYYKEKCCEDADYSRQRVTVVSEFENERQRLDLGKDIPPQPGDSSGTEHPDEVTVQDPFMDLYGKTGVYKAGEKDIPVAGAEFTLYALEDITDIYGSVVIPKDTEVGRAVTDENGRAAFRTAELPMGDYYAKETKTPEGYFSTEERVVFEAAKYQEQETIRTIRMQGTVKNAITQTLFFLRDDLTGNELAGAHFTIFDDNGKEAAEFTTEDTRGRGVPVKGLTPGRKYHIVEDTPRQGYTNRILIPEDMKGVLEQARDNEVVFVPENAVVNGAGTNIPAPAVVNLENAFVTGTFFIDKNGEAPGCVKITEEESYFPDGKITWRKSDFRYKKTKLEGAVFGVYAREDIFHPDGKTGILFHKGELAAVSVRDGQEKAVAQTDKKGCAGFRQMYPGEYEVKEVEAPNGYVRSTVVTPVDLTYKDYVTQDVVLENDVTYVNKRQRIEVTVTKRDAEDKTRTVEGAVFGIYAASDILNAAGEVIAAKDTLIETAVTGADGTAGFESDLPQAKYYIRELRAPAGYVSSTEVIEVDASVSVDCRETAEYAFTFLNEQTKLMVSMMDYDTEEELNGAVYTILDDKGEPAAEFTSAQGENTIIRGLEPGKLYTLTEKVPSDGYSNTLYTKDRYVSRYAENGIVRLDAEYEAADLECMQIKENTAKFRLEDAGGVQVISLFHKKKPSARIFLYDDLTGNELADATICITDSEGVPVDTVVTENTQGRGHVVSGLTEGEEYRITEVIPRYGYTDKISIPSAMKDVLTITGRNEAVFTAAAGRETVIALRNSYATGSFIVKKTGEGLADVKSITEERSFSYRVYNWMKSFFHYEDTGLGSVEFSVYAAEDIYHPDGVTGLLYRKGELVDRNVRTIGGEAVAVTDRSGVAVFDFLHLGRYFIKETGRNSGYLVNGRIQEVNLPYVDYRTAVVSPSSEIGFVNKRQKVAVTVINRDAEDKSRKPEGAVYGLYARDEIRSVNGSLLLPKDSLIETVCTSARGYAKFESDIPLGRYYVKEIESAFGYAGSGEIMDVDVSVDRSGEEKIDRTVIFETERTKTVFALMDYESNEELTGINFHIYDERGNQVDSFAAERGNNPVIRGLEHHTVYTLVEEIPHYGYGRTLYMKKEFETPYLETGYGREKQVFDATEQGILALNENIAQFKLKDKRGVQIISLFNKPAKGGIRITDFGEVPVVSDNYSTFSYDIKGLPGTQYEIYAKEDIRHPDGVSGSIYKAGEQVGTVTADENGVAAYPELYLGTYSVIEVKAANGYVINKEAVEADIDADYRIRLYANKDYQGVPFFTDIKVTNERQVADFGRDLPLRDPEKDPDRELGRRTGITVYGRNGDRAVLLEGAEFSLYAKKNVYDVYGNVIIPKETFVEKAVSDKNGRVRFLKDLPLGTYYAKQTRAPYGYEAFKEEILLDAAKHLGKGMVEVVRAGTSTESALSEVTLLLTDSLTGNELSGVGLRISRTTGEAAASVTTADTGGKGHAVYGLNPGERYCITEIIPREGYTNSILIPENMDGMVRREKRNQISFVVPEDGRAVLELENEFVVGEVLVSKTGEILDTVSRQYWECVYLLKTFNWMSTGFGYISKGIEGAEFTVFAAEDIYHPDGTTGLIYRKGELACMNVLTGGIPAISRTNPAGTAYFGEMFPGRYVIRETDTTAGFASNHTETGVTLQYKDYETRVVQALEGSISIMNDRQKVSVSVVRKDSESQTVLKGAIFGLYAKDDIVTQYGTVLIRKGTLIETKQTDAQGVAYFGNNLPPGWYYLKELIPPYKYEPYTKEIDINASSTGDGRADIRVNVEVQGSLQADVSLISEKHTERREKDRQEAALGTVWSEEAYDGRIADYDSRIAELSLLDNSSRTAEGQTTDYDSSIYGTDGGKMTVLDVLAEIIKILFRNISAGAEQ